LVLEVPDNGAVGVVVSTGEGSYEDRCCVEGEDVESEVVEVGGVLREGEVCGGFLVIVTELVDTY
jgi:hypothetical protein